MDLGSRAARYAPLLRPYVSLWPALLAALLLAGCGAAASQPSSAPGRVQSAGGPMVRVAEVSGLGRVLVNAQGRTLYTLSSEHGGELTCTAASGCLTYWPELDLGSGSKHPSAGSGVQAAMLGTIAGADGRRLVTYSGWPLYTYSGDTGAGQSRGEGQVSYGGTWWAVSAAGTPVKATSSPSTPSPSSGAYGY